MITMDHNIFSDYIWMQYIIWYIWISLYHTITIEYNMSYDPHGIDISCDYNVIYYIIWSEINILYHMITIKYKLPWDLNSIEHHTLQLYIICQIITIKCNLSKIYSMSTIE